MSAIFAAPICVMTMRSSRVRISSTRSTPRYTPDDYDEPTAPKFEPPAQEPYEPPAREPGAAASQSESTQASG